MITWLIGTKLTITRRACNYKFAVSARNCIVLDQLVAVVARGALGSCGLEIFYIFCRITQLEAYPLEKWVMVKYFMFKDAQLVQGDGLLHWLS